MIFFTVLFLGTLYTKLSHDILQPCKLANERFADAVGFAVPCPLPGLTDHIKPPQPPAERKAAGHTGQRIGHSKAHSIGKASI